MTDHKELTRIEKQFHLGIEDYQQGLLKPLDGAARELGWFAGREMAESKSRWLDEARKLAKTETELESQTQSFYRDISGMSIDTIHETICDWAEHLKEGDEVFVIHSPAGVGWQSKHSFTAKVEKVTDCRIRTDKNPTCCVFHRKSGRLVKGVDGAGDFCIIPPWLNPKDLEETQKALTTISRASTLTQLPTAKLLAILEQIEG